MSIAQAQTPTEVEPPLDADIDYEQFITEDDAPVDSIYAERQHRLLLDPLCASWSAPGGQPHVAFTDVGVFYAVDQPAVVPDVMVGLGVTQNPAWQGKRKKSYFIWLYGKSPDVAIEVVCNRKGGEFTNKLAIYEQIRVPYYVVWDPDGFLSETPLQCMTLTRGKYGPCEPWIPEMELGLTTWTGEYDGYRNQFLRWCDAKGKVLPTGFERAIRAEEFALASKLLVQETEQRAKVAEKRAKAEKRLADEQKQRADAAEEKARKLAEKMRSLGIDPENL